MNRPETTTRVSLDFSPDKLARLQHLVTEVGDGTPEATVEIALALLQLFENPNLEFFNLDGDGNLSRLVMNE